MCGCEKVRGKDELSGSTQEVYHRILHHHLHHHHHHHHHLHHHPPLPLRLPSPLHVLPALNKNPVGLFHFLFCFFCFSCFQASFLLIASFHLVEETPSLSHQCSDIFIFFMSSNNLLQRKWVFL